MRVKPAVVFIFEQTEEESIRRLSNRRIDPQSGMMFNLEVDPPSDEATSNRLIELKEDHMTFIKQKYSRWMEQVPKIEDYFKMLVSIVQSDRPKDQMTQQLTDMIENPMV